MVHQRWSFWKARHPVVSDTSVEDEKDRRIAELETALARTREAVIEVALDWEYGKGETLHRMLLAAIDKAQEGE